MKSIAPLLCVISFLNTAAAPVPPAIDFRDASEVARWKPQHDVAALRADGDGMVIDISGADPFLAGPAIGIPAGVETDTPFVLEMTLKSEQGGMVEVFYYPPGGHAAAGRSASARVAPGDWQVVRMALPALGRAVELRIDPPGTGGKAVIQSLVLRPRLRVAEPKWPAQPKGAGEARFTLKSGPLTFTHDGRRPGGFHVSVDGRSMAVGMSRGLVGYVADGSPRWAELPKAADVREEVGALVETSTLNDADGAAWRVDRRYVAGAAPGTVDVETRVSVDKDREAVFVPALVLLPGAGSFGGQKSQAVFAGLEYLDSPDASSSEADVTGPGSVRRVPATRKVTFPLMAVSAQERYVGLMWERNGPCSPLFDSPDRAFRAGGHVMGLVYPGGEARGIGDGDLLPGEAQTLKANSPLVVRATILGGAGKSVVPAVQQYVALRGLPPVPATGTDAGGYYRLATGGWLDSKLREGSRVRHAVWTGFGAQPAADAAVWMQWLAGKSGGGPAGRLRDAASDVVSGVPPAQYDTAHVSHVTYPAVASLVFGHVEESARAAEARGKSLLERFEPDGTVRYRVANGKTDFGRTHFAPDANGLTAALVVQVLRCAAVSGDRDLLREGLRALRAMNKFEGSVPRGAQTWEVPLHTPDILASAHLVRAYSLGYELTGHRALLEQAQYWAWTGLPFIYLDDPVGKPVGPYATVPVFGASSWIDVWFGRPVQWCGLVYADALYDLSRHDPSGPWKKIADGVAASGVQQSWPASDRDRQGLLPDFYHLPDQVRDGPAINPGTLQSCAARLFGGPAVYGFHCFRRHGVMVHVPGSVADTAEEGQALRFVARGWPDGDYFVLVSGLKAVPSVVIDGHPVEAGEGCSYVSGEGRLVLRLKGSPLVHIELR